MGILVTPIVWDLRHVQVCEMKAAGTKAVMNTLNNAAAVDAGNGQVTIPCDTHGFLAGSHIGIRGSTNYDGTYEIVSVAADTFNIYATYVAENFTGLETLRPELEPGRPFRILEARFLLNAVGGAAEDYTISLDSGLVGAAKHDVVFVAEDMNAQSQIITDWTDKLRFFRSDDKILFTYANSNNKNWGLEVKYIVN